MNRGPQLSQHHIDIALAAIARGLIDMRVFAEALVAAGASGSALDEVWLKPGRLNKKQLDSILLNLEDPVAVKLVPRTIAFGPAPQANAPNEGDAVLKLRVHTLASFGPTPNGRSDTTPAPPEGASEVERYHVLSPLGGGGMGDVYACRDGRLDRRVALKAVRPDLLSGGKGAALLNREARLTARLEHPGIIPVYDAGDDKALGPYYVMRIVDRPSLEDLLGRLKDNPGLEVEYTLGRLLRAFVQVCNAIDYAHSEGVVHCDLKPANILMGPFGEVLVVDWGLAQSVEAGTAQRGGTPGYMAPEQMAGADIDVRADVFALGAMLYKLLTLEPAFSDAQLSSFTTALSSGTRPEITPTRPSVRAPNRNIPPELEEVCMKALETNPSRRYQSAREIAAALETFIEGRRESERRNARADELVANGEALGRAYQEFIDSRPQRVAELDSLRALTPSYEKEEQKRVLWDAEDCVTVIDGLAIRTLQGAISSYEQALDEVRDHVDARRGLAELYSAELERAIARRDEYNRVYFEGLVKQYDDTGSIQALIDGEGSITLDGLTDTSVSLARYELVGRRLILADSLVARTPLTKTPLSAASYVLTVSGPSFSVRAPVLVRPGRESRVSIDPIAAKNAEPQMVYVPAGPALMRGEEGHELREVDVGAFFIGERPVTFRQYLEFAADQFRTDADNAVESLPQASEDSLFWRWDGKTLVPGTLSLLGVEAKDALDLPAVGIDVHSAAAYAAWLGKRSSKKYRLPSEDEWEKAARGVDGRRYPWGDHFDASFCHMRQSRPGVPQPEPSGAFPTDVSPYGVCDIAGGVADWVRPGPRAITTVARGGAWCDWPSDCRLAVRRVYWASERSTRVGFRLARSA